MSNKTDSAAWKYPVTSFQNALEVAHAVAEAGGANADVQNPVTAHALHASHTSGAFAARLSSARTYGMIIGGRNGYRLTDGAKRYFFPASEADKRQGLFELLAAPPIFSEIIKRFDGNKLPGTEMLANVLMREMKVPESWKERVARFFLKAAQDAGVVDGQGFLRYASGRHAVDSGTLPPSKPTLHNQVLPQTNGDGSPAGFLTPDEGMNAWVFSLKGKTVKVETSNDLSPELWKKLNSYVQVLRPFEEGAES
jgi:hypothetical protein